METGGAGPTACLPGGSSNLAACEHLLAELLSDEKLFRSEPLKQLRGLITQLAKKLWKGNNPKTPQKKELVGSDSGHPAYLSGNAGVGCSSLAEGICEVKPAQFSRLLYTNPVCILSSCSETLQRNLMTISWLTPLDNHGRLLCSINKRRHSAAGVLHQKTFVLNVPTAELAPTLLEIGGCSGDSVDKLERFSGPLGGYCQPGWKGLSWPPGQLDFNVPIFAVAGCVAHLVVQVEADLTAASGQDAHHILACKTLAAYVRPSHWDGKIFCPRDGAQPYLTFFGSQTFGVVLSK